MHRTTARLNRPITYPHIFMEDPNMTGKPEEVPNNENANDAEQAANNEANKDDAAKGQGE